MSYLMMFPGQGSQSLGMLADWKDNAVVTETVQEANDVLGFDIAAMIADGPEDALNATENTQPAMLAADIALWRAWKQRCGSDPAVVAGHSLGEYAAVVAAGCLTFSDALTIARLRGQAMRDAVADIPGAMAAVVGLDNDAVIALCAQHAGDEVLQAVNFNAPGQVVIAGHQAAVERAIAAAKPAGARMAMTLPVSVPAHSSLMHPARDAVAAALENVTINDPNIPLIQNTTAAVSADGDTVRRSLIEQVAAPVRWVESIQSARQTAELALECGPGKVLCGLVKRIDRSFQQLPLGAPAFMDAALTAVGGSQSDS